MWLRVRQRLRCVHSPQWLSLGSPRALALQLEVMEDDPFAHELRSTSTVSVPTTARATAETSEPGKQASETTIPLEAKEPKRRGRQRKGQKKSGRSRREEDLPTQRRDDSDSNGEGDGKANDGKRSGSRNGNRKEKQGSDREPIKAGTSTSRSPKGQHSCTKAKGRKQPKVKSVLGRIRPTTETVREHAVVLAAPTPRLASTRALSSGS